jgi:hypothetical protein
MVHYFILLIAIPLVILLCMVGILKMLDTKKTYTIRAENKFETPKLKREVVAQGVLWDVE